MDMDKKCANCNEDFKVKPGGKGYWRFSLENTLPKSDTRGREYLSRLTNTSFTPVAVKKRGKFLCPQCWSLLSEGNKYQKSLDEFWSRSCKNTYVNWKSEQSGSRTSPFHNRVTSTPISSKKRGFLKKSATSSTRWDPLINHIKARRYSAAIKGLYNATAGTRRHFHQVIAKIVREEIRNLLTKDFPLFRKVTMENINSFSWNQTLSGMREMAPLTFQVLSSGATTPKGSETLTRGKKNLKPPIGVALSALLHAKASLKASFLPTLFSIQLWRGGIKNDTLKQISHAGLCLGYKGTISAIDNIRKSFDYEARSSKASLEEQLSSEQQAERGERDNDELELSFALSETVPNEDFLESEDDKSELDVDESDEESWTDDEAFDEDDDVDLEGARDSLDISGIEPIPDEILEDEGQQQLQELHPGFTTCWDNVGKKVITRNPSEDKSNTYMNMALGYLAVNRVPVSHLEFCSCEASAADLPLDIFIPNAEDFSERQFRMTTILGRIICRHIPWFRLHFGDCTVNHIIHAHSNEMRKKSQIVNLGVFDENPSSTNGAIGIYRKLQQYVPSVNGKPYPTIVYGDGLSCERGNGAHNACSRELDAWKRLEGLEPSPQEFHKEMMLLQDFFKEFGKESASEFGTLSSIKNNFNFRQVKQNDISNCFSDAWELMCLATEAYSCLATLEKLGMSDMSERPPDAPEDIEEATKSEREQYLTTTAESILSYLNACKPDEADYMYCECQTDLGDTEPMVGCAAESKCSGREWYHLRCIGMVLEDVPKGEWFCSDVCKRRKKGKSKKPPKGETLPKHDHIVEYSKALVWQGLNLLCRRDAVREGDGDAMLSYWRFDLQQFFTKKHPKYIILAHRLLCAVNGWQELTWNRTVNYSGGIGRNLPMDLMNELLNRLFKDQLQHAKGRYTDETIQRCAQIIGPLGEALDTVFDENIIENELYRSRRRTRNRDGNVKKLVESLYQENIFKTTLGRMYKSFPHYMLTEDLFVAKKYPAKLQKLSEGLDRRKQIILDQ